jgi:hypothetical protein
LSNEPDCLSDDEFVITNNPPCEAQKKKNYDKSRKFQALWAACLPWAELFMGADGLCQYVKCTICSIITRKQKILVPKWDTLQKHGGRRKVIRRMPGGIKKGA